MVLLLAPTVLLLLVLVLQLLNVYAITINTINIAVIVPTIQCDCVSYKLPLTATVIRLARRNYSAYSPSKAVLSINLSSLFACFGFVCVLVPLILHKCSQFICALSSPVLLKYFNDELQRSLCELHVYKNKQQTKMSPMCSGNTALLLLFTQCIPLSSGSYVLRLSGSPSPACSYI